MKKRKSISLKVILGLLALGVAACGPQGMRLPEIPVLGDLGRDPGRIVYLSTDGNIYTIDPSGGEKRAVTTDGETTLGESGIARQYQFPAWSPDGRRLAFVGLDRSQSGVERVRLFTARQDGSDLVSAYESTVEYPFYLYWSPDSDQVAFLTTLPDQGITLKIVPATGGETRTLATGSPFYWDWAPDDRTLLIHTGGSVQDRSNARLTLLDLETGVAQDLQARPGSFQAPAWSPSGKEFVLGTPGSDGKESILLADREGEAIRDLVEVDAPVFFAWSPDGKKLAYLATDPELMGGLAQILSVIEPENPEAAVKAKEELVVAFFWSPDSRQIAFFTPAVFSPTPPAGQDGAPQQVFYLRLYVLDVQTGESRELALFRPTQDFLNILPYFDQHSRSATIWSPDSRNLVIPANSQEGEPNIFVVEADGDPQPSLITDGTVAFWSGRR